jgi:signal transduction histidine kinase
VATRWLVALGLPALLWACLLELERLVPGAPAMRIDSALFSSAHDTTTAGNAAARSVALPHDWLSSGEQTATGVYRFDLQLEAPPDRPLALFLPRASMHAEVFLNGESLGQGGSLDSPAARHWNLPLYFGIPNGMLRRGLNAFSVRLESDPAGRGLLREMYLGPDRTLAGAYRVRQWLDVVGPQWIALLMLTTAPFLGALWLLRRHETLYGWYAAAIVLWFLGDLDLFVTSSPVPVSAWDWLRHASLTWLAIAVALIVHRFLDQRPADLERALFAYGTTASVALAVLATGRPDAFHWLANHGVWEAGNVLLGISPAWRAVRAFVSRHDPEGDWLFTAGVVLYTFALHDVLIATGAIGREYGYFTQYSAPIGLLVLGGILLRRFVATTREQETLNRELEGRVREKQKEIEAHYGRLRVLESERVLADERVRIMQDMHDGVGGGLISTLAMLETGTASSGEVCQALRHTLEDLRLVIDSLDPADADLTTALGMFRARLEPRLQAAGIHFAWHVDTLSPIPDLSPRKVLQVLRILQEAVNNVIKHAPATTIRVSTGMEQSAERGLVAFAEIKDDGNGFPPVPGEGRGLGNMKRRALSIGADLIIASHPRGTTVKLLFPVDSARDADSWPHVSPHRIEARPSNEISHIHGIAGRHTNS